MKYLVLLLAFLACPSLSGAQATYTAASCDPAAINLQISKEHIHPVDGDIIAIPACTDTWTNTNAGTQVSGLFTKNVTIQGAGSVYACGTHGSTTCGSYQTEIIDNISNAHNNLMNFSIAAGKTIRVTGVALVENSSIQSSDGQLKITGAWTSQIRVDHCQLSSGYEGLQIFGPVIGVADHNYFSVSKLTLNNNVSIRNGANWGGLSDSGGNAVGDRSWAAPETWGTKYFFFIEDNQFHNGVM